MGNLSMVDIPGDVCGNRQMMMFYGAPIASALDGVCGFFGHSATHPARGLREGL